MAIGIVNKDSSFFTVEAKDATIKQQTFEKNIMSLSIREQTGMIPSGTIQFYDPNHIYSKIFRTNAKIIVSWGYKKRNEELNILVPQKINFDEITGSLIRRGFEAFVHSPSGSGDNGGRVIYNCNFSAIEFRGDEARKTYSEGTKKTVIQQAFAELGISPALSLIEFARGNEIVSGNREVYQDESTYRFLSRMALEWSALFHVGFSPQGLPVGLFIDPARIGTSTYPKWALGATGTTNMLGYMGAINNVKSYKWTSSESESGVGDNVKIEMQNGVYVTRRYVAETEKVITWEIVPKRIRDAFEVAADVSPTEVNKLILDIMDTSTFEEVEHFFKKIDSETAPQGFGYRINCEMIGNPLYTPPNQALLNNGFPDRITQTKKGSITKQNKFYLNSVSHTINKSGYNMSVEIVDTFILSPTGLVVRTV